jgi:hypothetical protein
LSGADVQYRGEAGGTVSDLILDQPSGEIAFVVIDPDENVLGIADTIRLVPAEVANLSADGIVRIDATKDMVLNSRTLPEDVSALEQRAAYEPVYKAYELSPPRFEPMKRREWKEVLGLGGWAHGSELCEAVSDAEEYTLEGNIVRIERIPPANNMSNATFVVVSTDEGNQHVMLGPSWYVDRQDIPMRVGDPVTITTRRATFNGKPIIVAWRVDGEQERALVLWNDDKPVWDRR